MCSDDRARLSRRWEVTYEAAFGIDDLVALIGRVRVGIRRLSMAGVELIRSFLQQASAQGSKSTALSPLGWLSAILVSAMIGAFCTHAPFWAEILLGILLVLSVVGYLGAYAYLMFSNPDALRSERFTLNKMAIERSVVGDTLKGFISPETHTTKSLEAVDMEQD